MKNKLYTVLLSFCILQALSCKKDNRPLNLKPQAHSLENGILSLSANGQLIDAIIDTTFNNITVTVASESAEHNVTLNFRLANGVTASINNTVVNSGIVLDLGKVVSFKIKSDDGSRSTSFTLSAQTELGYFGLSGSVVSQNSLDRSYEFYFDQFDG